MIVLLINFNIEKLKRLLYDFYRLTGLTVSVWDSSFKMLGHEPQEMSHFCRRIRENPEGARRCYLSDMELLELCAKTGNPATHVCHAGLADSVVPIKFNDEILGYIMFGQVIPSEREKSYKKIREISQRLRLDYDELLSLFLKLDTYDENKLRAASNVFKTSARYLWLSEYIEIKHESLAKKIEEFVKKNLDKEISVASVCKEMGISKNRLYKISHESFGAPFGDFLADMRVKKAKRLLVSSEMSISEICEAVGVRDYNYFSKFFKAKTGISPNKYRKNYSYE